ncbi:MAG: response regulator, partial [Pseudomonadota bacterium]
MKRCLVVDDSRVVRRVASRIIEALDFQVEEAGDGAE